MCGIVGLVRNNNFSADREDKLFINESIASLKHRGPDSSGFIDLSPYHNVIFGHTRLSILDLSNAGLQPMESSSKNIIISFNGEIYNHLKLRQLLKKDGRLINWRGFSDTETLVELIDFYGLEKTLNLLHGMFAFAIFDKSKKILSLARDKAGEKPLYYSILDNVIIFSSELTALTRYRKFRKKICKEALNSYLTLSYVPAPLSIYEDAYKLESGTYLEFNLSDISLSPKKCIWFNLNDPAFQRSPSNSLDYEKSKYSLDLLLNNAIEKQLLSDVEVGAFLSGGIDSSIVSAIAAKQLKTGKKLKTFSVSFNNSELDESKYAKQLSDYIGSDHYNIDFSDFNLLELIRNLPIVYDEPFADSSQLPTIALSEFASRIVKVCLSGDGGDEIFGGYNRYIFGQKVARIKGYIPGISKLIGKLGSSKKSRTIIAIFGRFLFMSGSNKPSMLDDKISKLLYLLSQESDSFIDMYKSILSHDAKDFLPIQEFSPNLEEIINDKELNFEEFLMLADFKNYLPDDIFVKVDRASMHFSLETRSPLLDEEIIEFTKKIPTNYKISGVSKRILRDVGSKYVPKNFFNRPKQGFSLPLEILLTTQLTDLLSQCREYLLDNCSHLIPKQTINNAMSNGKNSLRSPKFTWNLVVFSLWHEHYFNTKI